MNSIKLPFRIGNQKTTHNEMPNSGSIPRVKRLLALAYHYDRILAENPKMSQNMLASLLPITRARFTQILNLNFLSNYIKKEIMNLSNTIKGKDRISTKIAIKISQKLDWNRQNEMWEKMKADRKIF